MMPTTDRELSNEVHLWSDWIDERTGLEEVLEILDDEEKARAGRFRFERDHIRFVGRRVFLRRILAGYIGVGPAMIRYRTSSKGRPELEPPCGVTFSTSHSDGLATVAVASERLVGVDVERVRPIAGALDLAHRCYSHREFDHLRSLAESTRSEAFLTLWTRKESYVKAVGAGLSIPFDGFDVLAHDNSRTGRPRGPQGDMPYVFAGVDGLDGYVGAVTVSGAEVVTRRMTLTATTT